MERETQLKKEREEQGPMGAPCGRDRVEKEAGGQVQDGPSSQRDGRCQGGPTEMQNEIKKRPRV